MTKKLFLIPLVLLLSAAAFAAPTRIQAGAAFAVQAATTQVKAALANPASATGALKEQVEQAKRENVVLEEKESSAILLFQNGSAHVYLVAVVVKAGNQASAIFATVALSWSDTAIRFGDVKLDKGFTLQTVMFHRDRDLEGLLPKL